MKRHETAADLRREREAIEWFCDWKGNVEYHKLPIQYQHCDFALSRDNRVVSFIEVKGRSAPYSQYPHEFIAVQKAEALIALSRTVQIPVYVLYAYPDGYALLDITQPPAMVKWMQDSRRRDSRDAEPVICWDKRDMAYLGAA